MEVDFNKDDKAFFQELDNFLEANAQTYINVSISWKPKFEAFLSLLTQAEEELKKLKEMEKDFPKRPKIHSFYTTLHAGMRNEDIKSVFSEIDDLKREIRDKIESLYYYRGSI